MRIIATLLVAWVVLGLPGSHASIADLKQINIDFTNPRDAETKATWSEPDQIMVSRDGLGWDGDAAASRDGWIQTKPLALGLSWRPAFGVSVRVAIQPPPHEFALNNGQKTTPYAGDVYVRYSPDLKHWSSWQSLQRAEPQSIEEKKKPGRHYSGTVSVPYRERMEYGKLIADYSRLDVPWKSDEEAAVKWILDRDPEFFSKCIPFIGYVEFLFEAGFCGGQRIQSFKAEIGYGIGGEALLPRDDAVSKNRDVPWRYKDGNDSKAEPTGEANGGHVKESRHTPYEIVLEGEYVVFDKAESISSRIIVRNLGVKKMIAPDLYWGLSVGWDGKEYKRDPKHIGIWNGPGEILPKTAWSAGFSLSEYLVPAEALTTGYHTVALKDAAATSNTLMVFIEKTK